MSDITRILSRIDQGDGDAAEQLLPLIYDELRKIAAQKLAKEKPGQTLQATALVHEAYIRLVDVDKIQRWNGQRHFFAAAAEAMRRILVEHARRKQATGRSACRENLDLSELAGIDTNVDLVALDEALDELAQRHPDKAQLVTLRFFGGYSLEDAAREIGISRATAQRYWSYARAWLLGRISLGDR